MTHLTLLSAAALIAALLTYRYALRKRYKAWELEQDRKHQEWWQELRTNHKEQRHLLERAHLRKCREIVTEDPPEPWEMH